MTDFEYRKLFGLSHKEFLEEPVDIYRANMDIIEVRNRIYSDAEKIQRQRGRR